MATERPGARDSLINLIAALTGITIFSPGQQPGPELGDKTVRDARSVYGGMLEPIPVTKLRWYPPDIEKAQTMADTGNMQLVGDLCHSMRIDGVIRGLGDARTSVVDLPKRYFGSADVERVLKSKNNSDRSVYDEMIPATEARLMVWDGITAGVAIGEMVPVKGRNFPVLIRRYPRNLYYIWTKNTWYYRSIVGFMPIQPGVPNEDGNSWVLHIPGGRLSPWNSGLWNAIGRHYINKTQSIFARQSYEMKHSHPARVAFAPVGASEEERKGLISGIIRWAMNAAFMLPVGWDIKLVESNGRGIEIYDKSIETADKEIATALCGSAVMLQGTTGFSNMDVFRVVQKDLIRSTSCAWDHTVNTQILPGFIAGRWGTEAVKNATVVETDIKEPKDREAEARTMAGVANAIKSLVDAIAAGQVAQGVKKPVAVDVGELLEQFGIPTTPVSLQLNEKTADSGKEPDGDEPPAGDKPGPKLPAGESPKKDTILAGVSEQPEVVLSYIKHEGDKWVVYSEEGKELGKYDSKAEAEERLKQIEYYKHHKAAVTRERPQAPASLCLVCDDEGRYLCVTRPEPPYEFAIPGGLVDPGENSAETAIRELREECGIEIVDLQSRGVIVSPTDGRAVYIFEAMSWAGEARPVEANTQVAWLTATELLAQSNLYRKSVETFIQAGWIR